MPPANGAQTQTREEPAPPPVASFPTSHTDKGIHGERLSEGLREMAKFYFYLLFADDLHAPRCQIMSRKKPVFGFYQLRELRPFFSRTFFFFFNSLSTLAGFQFR